jgi:hypothetical protein
MSDVLNIKNWLKAGHRLSPTARLLTQSVAADRKMNLLAAELIALGGRRVDGDSFFFDADYSSLEQRIMTAMEEPFDVAGVYGVDRRSMPSAFRFNSHAEDT